MTTPAAKTLVQDLFASADIKFNGRRPGDIIVKNDKFYSRVIAGSSLALGESYMDGWWECDNPGEFMRKILYYGVRSPKPDLHAAKIYARSVLGNLQTIRGSKKVANVHYNLSSQMYMQFLGPLNQYSSYYYAHTDNDIKAEEARLELVCRKLKLTKNDRVLDIGCGWGGFAKYAASKYGCQVTGVSIAKEQIAHAKTTVEGLPVKFLIQDYRKVEGSFTKIFSGGMLEHVGYKNYRTYMKKIAELLTDDGIAVVDSIGGLKSDKGPDPWIGKYMFPNSMVPSPTQLTKAFEGVLVLEDWHNFGHDYGRTLTYWDKNFVKNWKKIQKLDPMFDERFYRMWRYYLGIFEGGFYSGYLQQWQLVLAKRNVPGGYRYER